MASSAFFLVFLVRVTKILQSCYRQRAHLPFSTLFNYAADEIDIQQRV